MFILKVASHFAVMKNGDFSMIVRNYLYWEKCKYPEITNTSKSYRKLVSIFLNMLKNKTVKNKSKTHTLKYLDLKTKWLMPLSK